MDEPNLATLEPKMPEKKCLNCGEVLIGASNRLFCHRKCAYAYNYRNNEDFRELLRARSRRYYKTHIEKCHAKSKAYVKEWLKNPENRLKWNAQMRVANKARWARRRKEWAEKKLCMRCGRERKPAFKHCFECLDKMTKWRTEARRRTDAIESYG